MTEENNDEAVIAEISPTVGQRLKQAREAKKITISEVAAQLRLTKESITYLETNQWDKLPGRAYARGYFSSYVSFLSLPQAELLSAFNVEYKITEPSQVHSQQIVIQRKSRLVPFLLVLIVIVITWFAYQQWQVTTIDENYEIKAEITNEEESTDAFSSSVVEPLSNSDNKQIIVEGAEPFTEAEQIIADELVALEEQTVESVEDVLVEQQTQDTIEAVIVDDVVAQSIIIELQFSEDSWVEVNDADGQSLIKKTGKAGKTITVSGRRPLNVLLGHATGVIVKYDNNIVDLKQYIKNDVARFSLGEVE